MTRKVLSRNWDNMDDDDQLVVVAVAENVAPIEMEPPVKRKRGRPKKVLEIVSETSKLPKPESRPKPSSDVPVETNRVAGRMSLRPNRRVDVRKGKQTDFRLFLFLSKVYFSVFCCLYFFLFKVSISVFGCPFLLLSKVSISVFNSIKFVFFLSKIFKALKMWKVNSMKTFLHRNRNPGIERADWRRRFGRRHFNRRIFKRRQRRWLSRHQKLPTESRQRVVVFILRRKKFFCCRRFGIRHFVSDETSRKETSNRVCKSKDVSLSHSVDGCGWQRRQSFCRFGKKFRIQQRTSLRRLCKRTSARCFARFHSFEHSLIHSFEIHLNIHMKFNWTLIYSFEIHSNFHSFIWNSFI